MSTPAVVTLKPLVLSELQPALNPVLITDGAGLQKVESFLKRVALRPDPAFGWDYETNITPDFWFRRARTLQVGDKDEQYVIDLLAFADGNSHRLIEAQGNYGKNAAVLRPVLDVVSPYLCSNNTLKVGVNLPFEYEVSRWCLGLRTWNFFSCDLVERVIVAGLVSLKMYSYYSLESLVARYFKLLIDKSHQQSFDLETPLTPEQIGYCALDTRMPLAVRLYQLRTIKKDQLENTALIEDDAIGSFVDMHIHGQNIDGDKWMGRYKENQEKFRNVIGGLDAQFLPIVGDKVKALDDTRVKQLEASWSSLGIVTPEELALTAQIRKERDKVKRAALMTERDGLENERKGRKASALTTLRAARSVITEAKHLVAKCEGQALINYNSGDQLLNALHKMRIGLTEKTLKDTKDDTLLKHNDKPVIKLIRQYRKLSKQLKTYGDKWVTKWITHPCKEEGWLHPGDGRLHSRINQLEAETGRTSSVQPNTQNLPKEDEIRACFICDPPDESIRISVCCDAEADYTPGPYVGNTHTCSQCKLPCDTKPEEYCIVTVDMAGAELRIIADYANAKSWIDAFNKGQDVHSVGTEILYPEKWPSLTVASAQSPDGWTLVQVKDERISLFDADGKPILDKDGKQKQVPPCAYFAFKNDGSEIARLKCDCPGHKALRDGNKATNFLLCYGGGPPALAEALDITVDEARELMRLHEAKFPDVWGYLKAAGEQARFKREARTMFGRRRLFPEPTFEGARQFLKNDSEESKKLEYDEDDQKKIIEHFTQKNGRKPTEDEKWSLTHREPTDKEVRRAYFGMFASIERRGKNMGIQGTNADIIKRAMGCGFDRDGIPYLWHSLPQYKAKLLNMVHDELVLQCPKRFGETVLQLVGNAFTRAAAEVMTRVKMDFDGHVDVRWRK